MLYGTRAFLYGGKLCENIVQAVARDLLVEAVLRLESRGIRVLFHVHDEVVVEAESVRVKEVQQAVEQELARVPEWANGLPIACEVKAMERYKK
jgi:DNA polymerase